MERKWLTSPPGEIRERWWHGSWPQTDGLPVEGGDLRPWRDPERRESAPPFSGSGSGFPNTPPGPALWEGGAELPAAVAESRAASMISTQRRPSQPVNTGSVSRNTQLQSSRIRCGRPGQSRLGCRIQPFRRLPPALYGHRRFHRIVNEVSPLQNKVHPKGLAKGPLRRKGADLQGSHRARFKLNQERQGVLEIGAMVSLDRTAGKDRSNLAQTCRRKSRSWTPE